MSFPFHLESSFSISCKEDLLVINSPGLSLSRDLFCLQFQGMVLLDLVFLVDGTAEREVFVVPLQSSWTPCDHEAAGVHGQPTWTNRCASHAVGRTWEGGKGPDSHSF